MKKNSIALRPSYWAFFSGGKDSSYMLYRILSEPEKFPLNGVVHLELDIDYPFISSICDYFEDKCKSLGIPFVRIRPRSSWFELYEKYGFPTRKNRWCNSKYKLDGKKQLQDILYSHGEQLVSYIGYCADETSRFAKRKDLVSVERYPLVELGVNEDFIYNWAKNEPLFNDYYKFNYRCGCMFCPMASRLNLAYLYVYYRDKYDLLIYLAKQTEISLSSKLGRPFSVWDKNPRYNTDYISERVVSKYVPLILQRSGEYID